MRFPRRLAAASLKLFQIKLYSLPNSLFSAAFSRGLIEAATEHDGIAANRPFSAAFSRGLIEASRIDDTAIAVLPGFPRRLAAASLKQNESLLFFLSSLVFRGV